MKNIFKIALLVLGLFSFCTCEKKAPDLTIFEDYYMKAGDSMIWAQQDYDDSKWKRYIDGTGKGVFWFRFHFSVKDWADTIPHKGISIGAAGSYELYWDGILLGKNGVLKTASTPEVHGEYIKVFPVPDSLANPGKHVATLRMTKESPHPNLHAFFNVQSYDTLIKEPLQVSLYMFMLAGAFLIAAIYFFFTFINKKGEGSILIFSIICLVCLSLLLMEYLKLFYSYPYPFQRTRLEIIGYLHIALTWLIPLFFMIQFSIPRKRIIMAIIIIASLWVQLYFENAFDYRAWLQNILMWSFAVAIIAYACYKKLDGAYIVMAGLIASINLIFWSPELNIPHVKDFDISVFVGFIIIVLSMLYIMTLRQRKERAEYEASLVLSERLKNELLKKNIKPHFIMNTLTSLIDWVEESPKQGVEFIHALAGEFEILNKMADEKLVPVEQEIQLCKNHLKVMGFRKEINYIWQEENIDPEATIPPAIIHTAVENGVTHSIPDAEGKITFYLEYEEHTKHKQYTLFTFANNRKSERGQGGGTGLRYIQSRLQESYPNRWELNSQAHPKGWETSIKIFKA